MLVVGGSASKSLAKNIAENLDCEFVPTERKRFPDGEIYVRLLREVEEEEILVTQSTCYPPNQNYMELFLLSDALKDLGASKINAIIPYLAYARQDERFKPGEAISLKTISKMTECAGVEELFLIDLHNHPINQKPDFFNIPTHNLTAAPALAKHINDKYSLESPIVLGPDGAAKQWAKIAGETIKTDWDFLVKKRIGPEKVEITPHELEVEGKDVIIIDDIISTGGTMIEAIKILKKQGAEEIYASCTHPVLSGDALEKIGEAGARKVISTDTIESEISEVSVAPVVAEAINQ